MSVENAIYGLLSGDSDIVASVGPRIYPAQRPEGAATPYIVYRRNSAEHVRHMQGSGGLARTSYELSAWSTGYDQAFAIGEYVRLVADNYHGTPAGSTTFINRIFLESDSDDFEPSPDQQSRRTYCRRGEYTIWHAEPST